MAADEREDRYGDERAGDEEDARPPVVGNVPEPELRDGVRHLEAHLQRARREERHLQVRDEERQQRRVDVAVAVDDEVRSGQQQDGRMKAEGPRRLR